MVKNVILIDKLTLDTEILDFNFCNHQTKLMISNPTDTMIYDLVQQKYDQLTTFGGVVVEQRHLKFVLLNNLVHLYKLSNILEITTGSLLAYHTNLAIIDDETLKICDLKTMDMIEIPSFKTLKLEYNKDGSLLFQLLMDETLLIYNQEMSKIMVGNCLSYSIVGKNEILTLNGSAIYLLICQDLKITTVFLMNTTSTMITTFDNFVCLQDGDLVEIFVLKFRPLPRLDKM